MSTSTQAVERRLQKNYPALKYAHSSPGLSKHDKQKTPPENFEGTEKVLEN